MDHDLAAFYAEHGWCVTPTMLPLDLVDRARNLIENIESAERDGVIPESLTCFLSWRRGQPRPKHLNQYIMLQYRVIAALVTNPVLGEIAARLCGSEEVRIFNTALIVKDVGEDGEYAQVGWHCEIAYWPTCSSNRMLTAWIPLQDTTVELGTLTVVDRSHAWPDQGPVAELRRQQTFSSNNHRELAEHLTSAGLSYELVPLELKKGQVSFHHAYTLHGSSANAGSVPRIAISVHLQDGENSYRRAANEDGSPARYVNDRFVRRDPGGWPDYRDPEICPVVWSKR